MEFFNSIFKTTTPPEKQAVKKSSYISVEEDYKNAAKKIIKEVILNSRHPNDLATYLYSAYQKQRSEKIKDALCDIMKSRNDFYDIIRETYKSQNIPSDPNDLFNSISKQFSLMVNPLTKEQEQEYIKEIHESFDKKMDELLAETKVERFPEFQTDDKIDRLIEMGLGKSSAVKSYLDNKRKHDSDIQKLNETHQIYTDLMYFKQKYPHNNTLTEQAILDLCRKYNLIFATSARFIGDIPAKSIEKIVSFKVDSIDDISIDYSMYERHHQNPDHLRINDRWVHVSELTKKGDLHIAGTVDQFDTRGMKVENFLLVKDDPLVFYPVQREGREYWMYVEGWGVESEDDTLKNDIVN